MFPNFYAPVFVKHLDSGSKSPWSERKIKPPKPFSMFFDQAVCVVTCCIFTIAILKFGK